MREKAWEEGFFKFSKLYYLGKPYSINIFNIKENKCFEQGIWRGYNLNNQ